MTGYLSGRNLIPVNKGKGRHDPELMQSPGHGHQGGLEDIDPVDLPRPAQAQRPGNGNGLDVQLQLRSFDRGELLGISQTGERAALRQNHGRCHHRTCQAAPPRFVYTGKGKGKIVHKRRHRILPIEKL